MTSGYAGASGRARPGPRGTVLLLLFRRNLLGQPGRTGQERGQLVMGLSHRELPAGGRLRRGLLGWNVGHGRAEPSAPAHHVDLEVVIGQTMRPSALLPDPGPALGPRPAENHVRHRQVARAE